MLIMIFSPSQPASVVPTLTTVAETTPTSVSVVYMFVCVFVVVNKQLIECRQLHGYCNGIYKPVRKNIKTQPGLEPRSSSEY